MQRTYLTRFSKHSWKNSQQNGNRKNFRQYNQKYFLEAHSQHYTQWGKHKSIPFKIKHKTSLSLPALITSIQ